LKIIGIKFFGTDSSMAILDIDRKNISAFSSEQISRRKHDDLIPFMLNQNFYQNSGTKDTDTHNDVYLANAFTANDDNTADFNSSQFFIALRETNAFIKPVYTDFEDYINTRNMRFRHKLLNLRRLIKLVPQYIYYYVMQAMSKNNHFENILFNSIQKKFPNLKGLRYFDHHLCHAASAYFLSSAHTKSTDALVVTLDGFGNGCFSKVFIFKGKSYTEISQSATQAIECDNEFASIGTLYGKFTEVLGFQKYSDEGKVEALAAYGKCNKELLCKIMKCFILKQIKIKINIPEYSKMTEFINNKKILLTYKKEDIAATIQSFLEYFISEYIIAVKKEYKYKYLCLAGGVFANVSLNKKIFSLNLFKDIFITPIMNDSGTALGAAFLMAAELHQDINWTSDNTMPFWGYEIKQENIISVIKKHEGNITAVFKSEKWSEAAAEDVLAGKIIALTQGRGEFGPRALGNRSILSLADNISYKNRINAVIKKRNHFQPFCPVVLEEDRKELFVKSFPNKHMTCSFKIKRKYFQKYPAACHINQTCRPQFITRQDNQHLYQILLIIKKKYGEGLLINTSFNIHGRAMVYNEEDAVRDFFDSGVDVLYLGQYRVTRAADVKSSDPH